MDPNKLLGNVPWITKEGYFDPAQFPIDGVLKQARSDDDQEFRTVSGSTPIPPLVEAAAPLVGNATSYLKHLTKLRKTQLALAFAHGVSAAKWARANGVPRNTAYRWAKDPVVRASRACRPAWAPGGEPRVARDGGLFEFTITDYHLLSFLGKLANLSGESRKSSRLPAPGVESNDLMYTEF
jgi:hypothetical protein